MSNFEVSDTPHIPFRGSLSEWIKKQIAECDGAVAEFCKTLNNSSYGNITPAHMMSFAFVRGSSDITVIVGETKVLNRVLDMIYEDGAEPTPEQLLKWATTELLELIGFREQDAADHGMILFRQGEREAYGNLIRVANWMMVRD